MPAKFLLYVVSYNILYIIIQSIINYIYHHNFPSLAGRSYREGAAIYLQAGKIMSLRYEERLFIVSPTLSIM